MRMMLWHQFCCHLVQQQEVSLGQVLLGVPQISSISFRVTTHLVPPIRLLLRVSVD